MLLNADSPFLTQQRFAQYNSPKVRRVVTVGWFVILYSLFYSSFFLLWRDFEFCLSSKRQLSQKRKECFEIDQQKRFGELWCRLCVCGWHVTWFAFLSTSCSNFRALRRLSSVLNFSCQDMSHMAMTCYHVYDGSPATTTNRQDTKWPKRRNFGKR